MTVSKLLLPGKILNRNQILENDSRLDYRLKKLIIEKNLGEQNNNEIKISPSSSLNEKYQHIAEQEPDVEKMMNNLFEDVELLENIDEDKISIIGEDNNEIDIYISKPKNYNSTLPCILHIHGGGMGLMGADTICYKFWRNYLASKNLLVIGVDFRNSAGRLGNYRYPSGLNDCMSTLHWVNNNKKDLNISKVIISGESGGGNLSLALSLKVNKENKNNLVQGTYALCPYIYGDYLNRDPKLPSLTENDNYFIDTNFGAILASVYNVDSNYKDDFLAWPYWADEINLKNLKPHVISVNELDPLRDEGLAYYRKLSKVGVEVYCRTVNGTFHAADVLCLKAIPEICHSTLNDISTFAYNV
tara:strand:+ start:317 stop:1393 length:1077 start_codon:yes stop_codon:yes gene_type:complete